MKISLLRFFALAPLVALALPLHAAEFTFVRGNGNLLLWNQDGLWHDGAGNPYGSGIYPGAGDNVMMNYNGDGVGIPSLYMNGNRTITTLTGDEVSAFNLTNTRIYSGHPTELNSGVANTLNITDALNVRAGIYNFYSGGGTTPNPIVAPLNVSASILRLGTPAYTNTTDAIKVARVQFGSSGANSSNVHFSTNETIFAGVASRIILGNGSSSTNSSVSLGHVTFDMNVASVSASGIEMGTGAPRLSVASLHSNTTGGVVRIIGSGTLVIDPDTSTADVTGARNYAGRIGGTIRVEKEGDSLQIFSSTANDYTGGTAVNNGVLAVRNASGSGLGTGAAIVGNGGILAGNGRIGLGTGNAITVESGGAIAPGEDNRLIAGEALTYHTLTIADTQVSFQNGSSFNLRVGSDGSADRIAFTDYDLGQLLLGSEGLAINLTGELVEGQTYTLFTFADGSHLPVSSGLTEGFFAGAGFDGYTATFHYDDILYGGIGSISMTVVAIPEPGVALLLLPAVGCLLYRRFRIGKR